MHKIAVVMNMVTITKASSVQKLFGQSQHSQ